MTRPRILRDALSAVGLMTIVPVPATAPTEGPRSGVAAWFPAVGLALGFAVWIPLQVAVMRGWRGGASMVVGAIVVAVWAALTRFLHWDGLADAADGIWGGHTPSRRLEIMADSVIGSFGAAALVLAGAIMVASIGSLVANGVMLPVLVAPALGRLSATCASWLGKPARESGLGRSIMGRPSLLDAAIATATVTGIAVVCTLGLGVAGAVLVLAGVALALSVPHVLSGPVGGVTGDIMGASVMVCEVVLLAGGAIVWGA